MLYKITEPFFIIVAYIVKKVLISYGRILPQLDLGSIKGAADRWLEIKDNFGGRDNE